LEAKAGRDTGFGAEAEAASKSLGCSKGWTVLVSRSRAPSAPVGCDLVEAARHLLDAVHHLLLTCGDPFDAARYLPLTRGDLVCAARHLLLTGGNIGGYPVDVLPYRVEIERYCVGLLLVRRRGRSLGQRDHVRRVL
jgi:hypothetical protein